ncbi:oligosaccharide flippase family protein [Gallionella capsiferriformans]|uniref:Polysaccharide biosynthesis protein n=1 Tax=Gallionella capsiferriformans (strain ES-2) TaxID=395494 RepID=D9SFK6_GALCS|nr:oligosaccharide flippase family protein [Gallionella capsiferriformans]ADL55303.1 polysaccharide biosynthesis protein [Gallionella capsiferriformans ES-2]
MTSQIRAQERNQKIIKTAWSGLAAKIITVSVSLVMVPLSVYYLGKEQYGLWVTVSSMVAMLSFMDGGAGNAVINLIAHSAGANDNNLVKIISTAFFSLAALALIGCLLFLAAFPFVSWGWLLGVPDSSPLTELNAVVIIVGIFFFVSIFTTLVGKIQRGLQEGSLDNFWAALASILSLIFVYVAIQNSASLLGFVIAFLVGPLLAYMTSNIHYYFIRRRDLRPQLGRFDRVIAKNLFAVGGMFFVLQIAGVLQGQADNVIIANMLGPAAVADYSICMKLFLIPPMLFGLMLTPLWPAYREAVGSGDMQWVKQIFIKSMRAALLISLPSAILLVLFGSQIIALWVNHGVVPSTGLLIGCGCWMVALSLGSAAAVVVNALQIMTPQIIAAFLSGVVNIVLTIWLIPHVGAEGAVYGTLISYVFCVVPIYWLYLRKVMR